MRSFLSVLRRHRSHEAATMLFLAIAVSGCGDSGGTAAAKSEPEARFKGLRALSAVNTKESIAEHKKKALAELKQKGAGEAAAAKH